MPWVLGFIGEIMETRCHQGHSVSVIIDSQRIVGAWLGLYIVYHGAKKRNVESIFHHGILVGWRSQRKGSYHSVINEHDPDLLPRAERSDSVYWSIYYFRAEVIIAISVRAAYGDNLPFLTQFWHLKIFHLQRNYWQNAQRLELF